MKEEINIDSFIKEERTFVNLFKELGLKPALCALIRAFLIVSEGRVEFEASKLDLVKILYKINGDYPKKKVDSVSNAIKALNKWQEENKLTLIELVKAGSRSTGKDGKFLHTKSKYRFVVLAELAQQIYQNPDDVEAVIKATLAELKERFVPAVKTQKHHPNHSIRIAKNTIFTFLKRIFNLAVELGTDNPYERCARVLNNAWEVLNELNNEHSAYQNGDKFIAEFESKLNKDLMEDHKEEA